MYERAYGIDHTLNDMKVRIGMEPVIPRDVVGYSAVYSHYPKREGTLVEIKGLDRVQALRSHESSTTYAKPGDKVKFSRNGGERIVTVILGSDSEEQLRSDIATMESSIDIIVE